MSFAKPYCHFTLSLSFSLQATEQAGKSKEEKVKIALEKIKEANIKKVIVYAVNEHCSTFQTL